MRIVIARLAVWSIVLIYVVVVLMSLACLVLNECGLLLLLSRWVSGVLEWARPLFTWI